MVSIVVPVYNAEKYIEQTISSVLDQTMEDWELILVDDVSKDNSARIIEQLIRDHPERRIRLIRNETNAGAAASRNRGVDAASGRYIAFLDADDLWYPDKLAKQLQYMEKHQAALVFTSYEYGNEEAVPTGKVVRVPQTLTYSQALSRTVIFTSTVLIDTVAIGKPRMPSIASEDTATWWNILKTGVTAYGLDQPLAIYRRPAASLSSDKKEAVRRIWNLYRQVAGLGPFRSAWEMLKWAHRATVRRIVDDAVRSHFEAIKRFTVLQLSLFGLLLHTGLYAFAWFTRLYPALSAVRISQKGYNLGIGIRLYFRGHLLILAVYFLLLVFLSQISGGMRTGYLKPGSIFSSQITALVLTNILTYFQLSIIRNWLLPLRPFVLLFLAQAVVAAFWSFLTDWIYRAVFPARETLVVNLSGDAREVLSRFETRQDRFRVMKVMEEQDMEAIKRETLRWYGCVVINGGEDWQRKEVLEYCYRHFIRIYLVPKIGDLLVQGTEQMDLFDTPILELKEYTIRWEARVIKRMIDLVVSLPLLVLTCPGMIISRPKKQICMGKDGKSFVRHGAGLRNVLNGTMSLVGPMALELEEAQRLIEEDGRFFYRCRIKPGIMGCAQLYGKADTNPKDLLKLDLYYIEHFSLLNDFKLALQSAAKHTIFT